jgi:hypothetical protein
MFTDQKAPSSSVGRDAASGSSSGSSGAAIVEEPQHVQLVGHSDCASNPAVAGMIARAISRMRHNIKELRNSASMRSCELLELS